jgi:pimeloyl-ACP methyl ester carboxylesterase
MHRMLFTTLLALPALFAPAGAAAAGQTGEPPEPRKAAVAPGVELHYVERGKGVAIVFVHGSLGDYSAWDGQVGGFAELYRTIAYSRRYNYPNANKPRPNYSAIVDSEDLASLIKKLNLGKVHLIGHSYGGYAALFLAVKHPELVRTLTLAEPPLVFAGDPVDDAKKRLLLRARAAFAKGDPEDAVRTIVNSSREGTYDQIPEPFRKQLQRNAPELGALLKSSNMYPRLDRNSVRKLKVPTLLLSGEKSPSSHKTIDAELERLLPENKRQRVVIPSADHGMWFQQPEACRKAVLDFLRGK